MTTVTLADAVEGVLDAIVAAITAETEPDLTLDGIRSVVRGDRARPMPMLPAVWVVPEPARTTSSATRSNRAAGSPAISEVWEMPVRIAALVASDDAEQGARDAVRYAALARKAALSARRLGLEYVNDVSSTTFDAADRRSATNRNLHTADATVSVTFWVREGA